MPNKLKRWHLLLGYVLFVPFILWSATGIVFHLKPGYAGAYEKLSVRQYPAKATRPLNVQPGWLEVRALETILGQHLLVRTENGWQHLDPISLNPKPFPDQQSLQLLVQDAMDVNSARYGEITTINKEGIRTSTEVLINLDWNTLTFRQSGRDTRTINWLYRIHYLEWTGIEALDKVVGILGPLFVVLIAMFGLTTALKGPKSRET